MHERKEVQGRIAGKQIVYHALQDVPSDSTSAQLAALHCELTDLRAQIASTKQYEKSLRAELATLSAHVPTGKLREMVSRLEMEREEVLSRLSPLRNGRVATRVVSAVEQDTVNGEWRVWKGRVVVRKRICKDMWEKCSEALPEGFQRTEELWETLGLDGML
ncbi:TBPIP (Tat binding protein 1(TBP-1)-interacting protein) superfamily domain-containing protein [Histoplasma capsulatum var. duboisii H88]|nr:TBPIP (Tat binding protein 1(TBP-1)-interacting protein) superfamily domain-containing protein [Histoplasma capsulatum var. duboisii H88]